MQLNVWEWHNPGVHLNARIWPRVSISSHNCHFLQRGFGSDLRFSNKGGGWSPGVLVGADSYVWETEQRRAIFLRKQSSGVSPVPRDGTQSKATPLTGASAHTAWDVPITSSHDSRVLNADSQPDGNFLHPWPCSDFKQQNTVMLSRSQRMLSLNPDVHVSQAVIGWSGTWVPEPGYLILNPGSVTSYLLDPRKLPSFLCASVFSSYQIKKKKKRDERIVYQWELSEIIPINDSVPGT